MTKGRVGYDAMMSAFGGERFERDGVIIEVEYITTASDDPRDDDARYKLDVRARELSDSGDRHE